jgi:hypothetical protein
MKFILFLYFAFLLVGVLTIYLVENNIIKFQSDLDFEETQNIEQYILDWDTIVNDSLYAYDGSVRLQKKFFDYANYITSYNVAKDAFYDYGEASILNSGVWLYQITGNESFLQNAGDLADYIEKNYVYNSGIVINAHPLSNYVEITEQHTNQEILSDVAKLALVDSNYIQLTKTLADAVIEHEINHQTDLLYSWVTLDGKPSGLTMDMSYGGSVGLVSLLLAYEVTSDTAYLDQVKRTILAYWELRDKDTNLIPLIPNMQE